jgi:sugar/nucleoside kinase (ribokinase family)
MALDCVVIGRVYADHIFSQLQGVPDLGEEVYAKAYRLNVGGGAAITGCWLSGVGRSVAIVGCIGECDHSFFSRMFEAFHLDYAAVRWCEGVSGITCALSTPIDRAFVTYRGANDELEGYARTTKVLDLVRQARHLHVTAPFSWPVGKRLVDAAHEGGAVVSLDVGFQPAWYASDGGRAMVHAVDYFLPNEHEARCAAGVASGASMEEVLASLDTPHGGRPNLRRRTIAKLGGRGAVVRSGSETRYVNATAAQVVDTTGAGDAFDAGLIDGLLDGADIVRCMQRGCDFGAGSVRAMGGIPSVSEIILAKRKERENGN